MIGISPKLSPKKHKAIVALLEKSTIRGAAESIDIGEVTLYRWLGNDEFQTAYRQAKSKIVGHAISRLQNASGEAVDALMEIIRDKEKPPSTRVTAARTILEMAVKGVEIEDIEARVTEIEKVISERF